MAKMGIRNYRFSISWGRILPDGTGAVNEKGLAFYSELVDCLLENGIRPFCTRISALARERPARTLNQ